YLKDVEYGTSTAGKTTITSAKMDDKYRLLQVAAVGDGLTVDATIQGAQATTLTKDDFKINESMQKLYDADGKEV
ncbi:hypothetical protein DK853_47370, partial [Klebsiella oxytoca]